ncbi:AI-2E family transporter [Patescibacteria group bacterium]|nr:AI-2E family transporter [Patescibacteria group bacterium]
MKSLSVEKWFFFSLLLITFLFVVWIFRPFLAVLVVGASLAVVMHPIFEWLVLKKIPSGLAAMLVVLLFAIVLGVPVIGIGTLVFHQSQAVYRDLADGGSTTAFIDTIDLSLKKILPQGFSFDLREHASNSVSLIANNLATIFTATLSSLLAVLLTFISLFYFLKSGPHWVREIVAISPLPNRDDKKILMMLSQGIEGVIKGYLFIALIQGLLMGTGLAVFGVPNPALWGLVAMLTSLLPTIGTAFVSVPAIIFLLSTGSTWEGFGLAMWSIFLVGMIDNFLSPVVIGNKINIPPLFILFAVLGGIVLLGPVGLLVGPLAVSLLHTLIVLYKSDFYTNQK